MNNKIKIGILGFLVLAISGLLIAQLVFAPEKTDTNFDQTYQAVETDIFGTIHLPTTLKAIEKNEPSVVLYMVSDYKEVFQLNDLSEHVNLSKLSEQYDIQNYVRSAWFANAEFTEDLEVLYVNTDKTIYQGISKVGDEELEYDVYVVDVVGKKKYSAVLTLLVGGHDPEATLQTVLNIAEEESL